MRYLLALLATLVLCPAAVQAKEFVLGVGSRTFHDNGLLPLRSAYAQCRGRNVSPELHWSRPPDLTRSFAVTVVDPDAPAPGGWWHWLVYDIPATARSLHEGSPAGKFAANSFGTRGYGGPCPPPGRRHHYRFAVYALDVAHLPGVSAHTAAPEFIRAMRGHVLAAGSMVGIYKQ